MCQMQQAADRGWNEGEQGRNPFLFSSPLWLAYEAGRRTKGMGLSAPSRAKTSRGYSIRIKPCADVGLMIVFGRTIGSDLGVTHVHTDYTA